ncbi:AAA family ATPase [Pseudomonas aeruginosa]|uniref:AAA family ATPase n=2 Tax=Pseudomonas aeruginosa TaxID=287 RepID=UPI0022CE0245|nr:AAA family ATPase [Pseudomonas aeruginosa]MCZ9766384.1 ATP-binding protein [Pseudomonas aeruginosa]
MLFKVLPPSAFLPKNGVDQAFLFTDGWDDWFTFNTQYMLYFFDENSTRHRIGNVKIGEFGMKQGQRRPELLDEFDHIGDKFFSLGQDDEYYENLNKLGPNIRDRVLQGLGDIALDSDRCLRAMEEKVTGISLLRSVTRSTVEGQFRRLATGGARLNEFRFVYTTPSVRSSRVDQTTLSFEVKPASMPPTNIHVLIGRNGVGKTHMLNNMSRAVIDKEPDESQVGIFECVTDDKSSFANLVSVTFSAFDPFEPLPNRKDRLDGLPCAYVGLKRSGKTKNGSPLSPKSPEKLSEEFGASVLVCSQGARLSRWRRALQMLETDPIFQSNDVASLADDTLDEKEIRFAARKLFGKLSSGHKIVLLTITRLVETVEERTLVLLDEPEAHLHPPLLSAFVRSLSDLLVNRNGVAIIATHSPVVVQEVPASCVWKIRRSGRAVAAERPDIETFGENVGILTREIFGLEVTDAGFHRLLRESVQSSDTLEQALARFEGELGGEARALIRALVLNRGGKP